MEIENWITRLPWHPTRRWATRDMLSINNVIVHQSLKDDSFENINNYHISPNNHISANGCPHICYHYGINKEGEIIQANELTHIVWHTKGQNNIGVGVMLAGNFKGTGHVLGNEGPTAKQMESLKWLVGYILNSLDLTNQDVYGHYHYGKPACPGYVVSEWIETFRNGLDVDVSNEVALISIKELQKRLNKLGYDCGNVDGIIGIRSSLAIKKFQQDNGLIVDGVPGPQTRNKLVTLT